MEEKVGKSLGTISHPICFVFRERSCLVTHTSTFIFSRSYAPPTKSPSPHRHLRRADQRRQEELEEEQGRSRCSRWRSAQAEGGRGQGGRWAQARQEERQERAYGRQGRGRKQGGQDCSDCWQGQGGAIGRAQQVPRTVLGQGHAWTGAAAGKEGGCSRRGCQCGQEVSLSEDHVQPARPGHHHGQQHAQAGARRAQQGRAASEALAALLGPACDAGQVKQRRPNILFAPSKSYRRLSSCHQTCQVCNKEPKFLHSSFQGDLFQFKKPQGVGARQFYEYFSSFKCTRCWSTESTSAEPFCLFFFCSPPRHFLRALRAARRLTRSLSAEGTAKRIESVGAGVRRWVVRGRSLKEAARKST